MSLLLKCCFTSTETVGLLGTGVQDVHLGFHTAPEFFANNNVFNSYLSYKSRLPKVPSHKLSSKHCLVTFTQVFCHVVLSCLVTFTQAFRHVVLCCLVTFTQAFRHVVLCCLVTFTQAFRHVVLCCLVTFTQAFRHVVLYRLVDHED